MRLPDLLSAPRFDRWLHHDERSRSGLCQITDKSEKCRPAAAQTREYGHPRIVSPDTFHRTLTTDTPDITARSRVRKYLGLNPT